MIVVEVVVLVMIDDGIVVAVVVDICHSKNPSPLPLQDIEHVVRKRTQLRAGLSLR